MYLYEGGEWIFMIGYHICIKRNKINFKSGFRMIRSTKLEFVLDILLKYRSAHTRGEQ